MPIATATLSELDYNIDVQGLHLGGLGKQARLVEASSLACLLVFIVLSGLACLACLKTYLDV